MNRKKLRRLKQDLLSGKTVTVGAEDADVLHCHLRDFKFDIKPIGGYKAEVSITN